MNEVLLILPQGSSNLPFIKKEDFKPFSWPSMGFDLSDDSELDVDLFINEKIIPRLLKEEFDVILLPISLTENFLECLGLRLAYHIRLNSILERKSEIPIVFISDESLFELMRITGLSNIITTRGCYIVKPEPKVISNLLLRIRNGKLKGLEREDFKSGFLSKIILEPPANYQSHHSLANEWSILRWSEALGINQPNSALEKAKKNINSLLYYKFLAAKFPIEKTNGMSHFQIKGEGKILFIDDEWEKGWGSLLKSFFDQSLDLAGKFEVFEETFKDSETEKIVANCLTKVINSDPDIIILDLRLSKSDFEVKLPNELTGTKVLQAIKRFNPGIRVIIFTASNKVWNLLELQKFGANGFVLKESPEFITESNSTQEAIIQFKLTIENCLVNIYLKLIWKYKKQIKEVFDNNPLKKYGADPQKSEECQKLIIEELEAMFQILSSENENKFNHAMLMLNKILENLNDLFFKKESGLIKFYTDDHLSYFDKMSLSWSRNGKKDSTLIKAMNIAKLKNIDEIIKVDITSIVVCRNNYVHPRIRSENSDVQIELEKFKNEPSQKIVEWLNSITQLIENL